MSTAYLKTDKSLTVYDPISAAPRTFTTDQPEYSQGVQAIKDGTLEEFVRKLNEVKTKVEDTYKEKGFTVKDGVVFVDGEDMPMALSQYVLLFAEQGLPTTPLLNFWRRLRNNPSAYVLNQLYNHLEKYHHPIFEDGKVLGWKAVRDNYTDIHSGKFDNNVGVTNTIRRNKVDDDCNKTCSYGFHIASYNYAKDFLRGWENSHLMEVVFDPADVVSVPTENDGEKIRVCQYTVLRECTSGIKQEAPLVSSEGEPIQASDEDEYETCPVCGSELDEDEMCDNCDYCDVCGQMLESDGTCYECEEEDEDDTN